MIKIRKSRLCLILVDFFNFIRWFHAFQISRKKAKGKFRKRVIKLILKLYFRAFRNEFIK